MKKLLLLMAVIFVLVIAFSLHPLLALNGQSNSRWDNVTDNITTGIIAITGGGQVDISSTSTDGSAYFGVGVVTNPNSVHGHFTFGDALDLQCEPTGVFNVICGETASFTCNDYIVEVFAGDPDDLTQRGIVSIYEDSGAYSSVDPLVEGTVDKGLVKVDCVGRLHAP